MAEPTYDEMVDAAMKRLGLDPETIDSNTLDNVRSAVASARLSHPPRSVDRIDRITEKLNKVWHAMPDQRLGQLLANYGFGHHVDPFHVEDDQIEQKLDELLAKSLAQLACPHPGTMRGEVCGRCGGTFGV